MKNQGAILIQTLAFITILAILSMTVVNSLKQEMHNIYQHKLKLQLQQQTFNALLQAEITVSHFKALPLATKKCTQAACLFEFTSQPNWHDPAFWQQYGYAINHKDKTKLQQQEPLAYYHVMLLARHINLKTKIVTDYYQLTAASFNDELNISYIIQRIISKQYDAHNNALGEQSMHQSWRIIQ